MNTTVLLPDGGVEMFRDDVPADIHADTIITAVIHEYTVTVWEALQITRVTAEIRIAENGTRDAVRLERALVAFFGPGEWVNVSDSEE